jgi:hypothetical protein
MAGAVTEPDYRSYTNAFFFRAYLRSISNLRRPTEERVLAQMMLEDLLLSGPPKLFSVFQDGMDDEVLLGEPGVADWFLTFAASLDPERLGAVNLSVVELFWRRIPNKRVRKKAVDVIAKHGVATDPSMDGTRGSTVVSLFREVQQQPFELPLHPDAQLIIDTLFWRVKLMSVAILNTEAGRVGRYCLRLIRSCYLDEYMSFAPEQLDRIVTAAGPIDQELRDRIYATLL